MIPEHTVDAVVELLKLVIKKIHLFIAIIQLKTNH